MTLGPRVWFGVAGSAAVGLYAGSVSPAPTGTPWWVFVLLGLWTGLTVAMVDTIHAGLQRFGRWLVARYAKEAE